MADEPIEVPPGDEEGRQSTSPQPALKEEKSEEASSQQNRESPVGDKPDSSKPPTPKSPVEAPKSPAGTPKSPAEQPSGEQQPEPETQPETQPEQVEEKEQSGGGSATSARSQPSYEVDPTKPSAIPMDANATVKFVMMPSGQVATLRCNLSQTLGELKEHFAEELRIPTHMILLMFEGKNMNDKLTLAHLGVGPNGTVQLEMQSADPVNTPLKGFRPRQEYHMPDVITVRVQAEDTSYKDVVVEVIRPTNKKPFLGGFKHKNTAVEYHNASAQTMQKLPPPNPIPRYCRDTQTVQQKHVRQQTTEDTSTQMTKIGVYVTNLTDKTVVPGKYTTADEYHANILTKVILIQKYYRRWLAKKYVDKVRDDKNKRIEWEREEELRKKKEKEERIKKEFERRMNPKTKEDFDLLYHALEKWRLEELDRINRELTGAERKAALYVLLEQETQLIGSIERHKNDANEENRQKQIQGLLGKAAASKKWKGPDGNVTHMDTPYTIRAKELLDIYNSINMKYLTQDERLDVLLTLKHTVKEHDCKLTQEIIELIDREADLLMRGVKETNLEGLRKRISTLFLQYIKTPTFNPEIARYLKVPQDPSTLRKNIYFCSSCNMYLPSTEFQLSSNSKVVGKCRNCNKIDNEGRGRQDYSHYRYMLKALRQSESEYEDDSRIAFLLQENDLRYIVENIWNSQSALSAWEDLYDLVLVRWDRNEEWSPWNCILLTKEEATAHEKLEDLDEGYGKNFVHKVKHKHTLARNYFSRLPGMAEAMREKNEPCLGGSASGNQRNQRTKRGQKKGCPPPAVTVGT